MGGRDWATCESGGPNCPMSEKDLYTKPARFGDGSSILLRQYLVNSTFDLKTVTGHEVMTHSEEWIAGMGPMSWCVADKRRPELELIDQTLPLGSPWPVEEKKPHVPEKVPYNRRTRAYPGPLSIFAAMYGWHTPEMDAAFAGYRKWCSETGKDEASGSRTSNFFNWVKRGPLANHPAWPAVGECGANVTEHRRPMMQILKDLREMLMQPIEQ